MISDTILLVQNSHKMSRRIQSPPSGRINASKLSIANDILHKIRKLKSQDNKLTVLSFSSSINEVADGRDVLVDTGTDDANLMPALCECILRLRSSQANNKNIVIFTDFSFADKRCENGLKNAVEFDKVKDVTTHYGIKISIVAFGYAWNRDVGTNPMEWYDFFSETLLDSSSEILYAIEPKCGPDDILINSEIITRMKKLLSLNHKVMPDCRMLLQIITKQRKI